MVFESEEKRCFPRVKLKTPLRYQIWGPPPESKNTLCDNIGLGGLGFTSNSFISPKTMLALEIKILSRMLRPSGKVTWAEPVPYSNKFRIGVQFSEFNTGEKDYLSDYLNMKTNRL